MRLNNDLLRRSIFRLRSRVGVGGLCRSATPQPSERASHLVHASTGHGGSSPPNQAPSFVAAPARARAHSAPEGRALRRAPCRPRGCAADERRLAVDDVARAPLLAALRDAICAAMAAGAPRFGPGADPCGNASTPAHVCLARAAGSATGWALPRSSARLCRCRAPPLRLLRGTVRERRGAAPPTLESGILSRGPRGPRPRCGTP